MNCSYDEMEGVALLDDGRENEGNMSWTEAEAALEETPIKESLRKRKFERSCTADSGYTTFRSYASSSQASNASLEDDEDFLSAERENEVLENEDFQKLITGKIIKSPTRPVSQQSVCEEQSSKRIKFDQQDYEATVKGALDKLDAEPDLIGDFTRPYILPTITGKHQDLKSICPQTLYDLMSGKYESRIDSFHIVDCRFPYEYEGGHIAGASNIYMKEQIHDLLTRAVEANKENTSPKHIMIFHCEFSSERGPNLARYLRNLDREMNAVSYPKLTFPEIYLLEGGYCRYFKQFPKTCIPQEYLPMLHPKYTQQMREFRSKSKSDNYSGLKKASKRGRHNKVQSSKF